MNHTYHTARKSGHGTFTVFFFKLYSYILTQTDKRHTQPQPHGNIGRLDVRIRVQSLCQRIAMISVGKSEHNVAHSIFRKGTPRERYKYAISDLHKCVKSDHTDSAKQNSSNPRGSSHCENY